MKAKLTAENPTPVLPAEERDHARLSLSGLPKGKRITVAVTYDDRLDPIRYDVGETPDGTLEVTFPVVGTGGLARVFAGDTDSDAELVGKPLPLTK